MRKEAREAPVSLLPAWLSGGPVALSTIGLIVGTLFFAASLSPSLIPRTWHMQGVLSGLSLAAGYATGVALRWCWAYLELPVPSRPAQRLLLALAALACLVVAVIFLRQASEWQNSIRVLMAIDTVDTARPLRVAMLALPLFALILVFSRAFLFTFRLISGRLHRYVPRRISHGLGVVLAVAVFWSVIDGVLLAGLMRALDSSFQQFDALMEPEVAAPEDPARTGSAASPVAWGTLGRTGRNFVSSGPSLAALQAFHGEGVDKPIRVYIGLNSAEDIQARARLAVEELDRTGAFDRTVLVIATPTGTGWLDPSAIDTLEYLHRGRVATVALQYSYLPSWLSLLSEEDYGAESARALFEAIYGHWTQLPRDTRPRLYLHGLSLGALNSERSADLFDVIADPFHGALWSGPPFRSQAWRTITNSREPDSPAWLPRFRDGSIVRFTHQHNALALPGATWGPIRIVYLQYASDPVTFFEPQSFYRQPEWMQPPRGPDVSERLRWYPVVTMLQLAIDIIAADEAPMGFGHRYAPEHYIDAWLEVSEPPDWHPEDIERLKTWFRTRSGHAPPDETISRP